jgi:hypothetical protein
MQNAPRDFHTKYTSWSAVSYIAIETRTTTGKYLRLLGVIPFHKIKKVPGSAQNDFMTEESTFLLDSTTFRVQDRFTRPRYFTLKYLSRLGMIPHLVFRPNVSVFPLAPHFGYPYNVSTLPCF